MGRVVKFRRDERIPDYKNNLERFVGEKCYSDICDPLRAWISENPNSLRNRGANVRNPVTASLRRMLLEFTTNVSIIGDVWTYVLLFFAVKETQMYGFIRALFSIFFTYAGMLIATFIFFLTIALVSQFVEFIRAIINEALYRWRSTT